MVNKKYNCYKLVIYYNIKGGKQVSFIEMLESTEEPPHGGDPYTCNGVRISNEMAGDPGFEPGQADPESAVLPLDESPVRNYYNTYHKVRPLRRGSVPRIVLCYIHAHA